MKKFIVMMMIMLVGAFSFTSCSTDNLEDVQVTQDIIAGFEFDSYTSGSGQEYGSVGAKSAVATTGIDRTGVPININSITINNFYSLVSANSYLYQSLTYNFGDENATEQARMKLKPGFNNFTASAIQNSPLTAFAKRMDFIIQSGVVNAHEWKQDYFYKNYHGVCLGLLDATQITNIKNLDPITSPFELTYGDANDQGVMNEKIGMRMTPLNSILTINFEDTADKLYLTVLVQTGSVTNKHNTFEYSTTGNLGDGNGLHRILLNTANFEKGKHATVKVLVKEVGTNNIINEVIVFNNQPILANQHYFIKADNNQGDGVKTEKVIKIDNESFKLEGHFVIDWVTAFEDTGWNWTGFRSWN